MAHPRPLRAPGASPDAELVRLQHHLAAARSVLDADRGSPQRVVRMTEAAQAEVLECLEAYVEALTTRGLPIPPNLRDELRLRRRLCPGNHHD